MGNQQTLCQLTEKDIQILVATSNKSKDEIMQWYDEFLQDTQNTGRMNKQQFQKYYSKLRKNTNLGKLTDHIFRSFDTTQSG